MNSQIILSKGIKIDKNYVNVLNYSEEQMLQLCRQNEVVSATDYSFIRANGTILVGFTYNQCLQANYMAFQNPNYANKWFFAWIDDVQYKSEKSCEIKYTIDAWSTWFNKLNIQPCYVIRHHVNDDVVGNYTQPEGLELGEYIVDGIIQTHEMDDLVAVLQVTKSTTDEDLLATNYGGIWSAGGAYICPDINSLENIIQSYADGKNEAIIQVYLVPKCFINTEGNDLKFDGQASPMYIQKTISKPTNLDGYTPKNKKLLTFPFCYLNVSNNNGVTNSYLYELFKDNQAIFNIKGVPSVGGSIKCVPYQYKCGGENNNEDEGIIAGKYPTLSWSEDAYTNWLTQNAVNLGLGLASNVISIASGVASGNGIGIISGSMGIASQIGQVYEHSLVPYTAKGNTNGGDINTCSNSNGFYFYQMSIRQEYAKIIDDYFTRYGYKINRITTPNITGRPYWNYVEIGGSEVIGTGEIPSKYLDIMNNACRKGTTVWHNHDNIGNYNLNN